MKIVIADSNLVPHRAQLEAGLPDAVDVSWFLPGDSAILDELADAEVFVGSRFPAELAAAAPRLRLIHVNGAGTDRVNFSALWPETQVANTFHHEQSIAEYVASAAVMLRRDLPAQDRALRAGRWASSMYDRSIPQPGSLHRARVGFVGFGTSAGAAGSCCAPSAQKAPLSPAAAESTRPPKGSAGPATPAASTG